MPLKAAITFNISPYFKESRIKMLSMFTHLGGEGGCDSHKLSSEGSRAPHIDDIFEGGEEEEFLDVEDHDDDETHSKSDLRKVRP